MGKQAHLLHRTLSRARIFTPTLHSLLLSKVRRDSVTSHNCHYRLTK